LFDEEFPLGQLAAMVGGHTRLLQVRELAMVFEKRVLVQEHGEILFEIGLIPSGTGRG
jgi:hypothetical protein